VGILHGKSTLALRVWSEALDAYIILNPALAILTSPVPVEAPKEFIPHQHGTRF
jgi:hypothetical protein